jgi:hypothetical protein
LIVLVLEQEEDEQEKGMTDTPNIGTMAEPTEFGPRTVAGRLDLDTLTPRAIKRLLMAAECGELSAQAELFERMEEKDVLAIDGSNEVSNASVTTYSYEKDEDRLKLKGYNKIFY